MNYIHHQGGWVVLASFVLAAILSIVPLPGWAEPLRPEWAVLVLVYWCMAVPARVGVGTGWLFGLMLDVLHTGLLGQYALSLSVVAFLTLKLYQRLRAFPLWQQALTVLVMSLLHQLLILWTKGITGQPAQTWAYWMPSISGMLLWPVLFPALRNVRRRFRVS